MNSDAVTMETETDLSGTTFVSCNVTKMGFVALFEGPLIGMLIPYKDILLPCKDIQIP